MKRIGTNRIVIGLITALAAQRSATAQQFSDGFEAPTLDPFWDVSVQSGSIGLSDATVHSGQQSVRFDSSQIFGLNKYMELSHTLASPAFGSVSVWMLDTGADQSSSNYITLTLLNTALAMRTHIGTFDYDLGPGNGGHYYMREWVSYNGQPADSQIDRTPQWHHWEISTLPDSFAIKIDGADVFTGPAGLPFDRIALTMSGPYWRPAWTAYFDDFALYGVPCNPCDANCDGSVNPFDIQPFIGMITGAPPCSPCAGDTNADGSVNLFDIQGFVDCLAP